MPLEAPDLDTRTFDQLVEAARARISSYTPEWTDFNHSDPGMALVDLFAWFTELMLYQMNRVPERNYIKFLQLLNLELQPAQPARTDLTISVNPEAANRDPVRRGTQFGGQDPESGDFVVFETETGLDLAPHNLAAVQVFNGVSYERVTEANADDSAVYAPLGLNPGPGSAWYLGFGTDEGVPAGSVIPFPGVITLRVFFPEGQGKPDPVSHVPQLPQLTPSGEIERLRPYLEQLKALLSAMEVRDCPPSSQWDRERASLLGQLNELLNRRAPRDTSQLNLRWEYRSDDRGGEWQRLQLVEDKTENLQLKHDGYIRLEGPKDSRATLEGAETERAFHWIRCRLASGSYAAGQAPEVAFVRPNTVPVVNLTTIREEVVGISDGLPDQRFALRRAPVKVDSLLLDVVEPVERIEPGTDRGASDDSGNGAGSSDDEEAGRTRRWKRVDDIRSEAQEAEVYALNHNRGELSFGDSIHGRIPPSGSRLIAREYRFGGGRIGNLPAGALAVPLQNIEGLATVSNLRAATGGRDEEKVEELKRSAPGKLRTRGRAVTADDFSSLALEVEGVKRAQAIALAHPAYPGVPVPGSIKVVVVPDTDELAPMPTEDLLRRVAAALDGVRLISTELHVVAPHYLRLDLGIKVAVDRSASFEAIKLGIDREIRAQLNPLERKFGLDLFPTEFYGVIQRVDGVNSVLNLRLNVDGFPHPDLTEEIRIPSDTLFALGKLEIEFEIFTDN